MILAALEVSSSVHEMERVLFFTLLQLAIIILFARVAGRIAQKLGQPRVVGEIVGGLLLGPSLFGHLSPELFETLFHSSPPMMINILSQIGLVLLMFQIGLEFDFAHLSEKRNKKAVLSVAAAGILLPFGLGFLLGGFGASSLAPEVNPLGFKLFIATAFSITAMPVLGRIMMEFDLTRKRIGAIAITAAAINDVIGWVLLAVVSAMATAHFSPADVGWQIFWIVVYVAVCLGLVRPLLKVLVARFRTSGDPLPPDLLATVVAVVFLSGLITYKLGIFAIFGGFMMGVLLFDQAEFVAAWNRRVSPFVLVFFLPIFFTSTGLRTNIHGLDSPEMWLWCALIFGISTLGKFGGGWVGARTAGLSGMEAGCIGVMMNTKGLMELIILNVGYDLGMIPPNVFTMLVLMAVFSTVITSPFLRLWLPKIGYNIPLKRDA